MAFKPKIIGLDKTIAELRKLSKEADKIVLEVMEQTAYEMVKKASQLVPKNLGKLNQSIRVVKGVGMNFIVEAGGGVVNYAPYVEFGTGGLVEVPKEFDEQARLALGKGLRQVNLHPKPFMYPAYLFGKKQIKINLKKEIESLSKSKK